MEKRKCLKCDCYLRKIGIERKNGKILNNHNGKDWKERSVCKKCYKNIQEQINFYLCNPVLDDKEIGKNIREIKMKYNL